MNMELAYPPFRLRGTLTGGRGTQNGRARKRSRTNSWLLENGHHRNLDGRVLPVVVIVLFFYVWDGFYENIGNRAFA